MGYNRNTLTKIIEVQDLTLEHTRRGISQKWVYNEIIKPRYFMSERTFYRYLSLNAKCILKKLNHFENKIKSHKFV